MGYSALSLYLLDSFDMVVVSFSFSISCIGSCDFFPLYWLQSFCNGLGVIITVEGENLVINESLRIVPLCLENV